MGHYITDSASDTERLGAEIAARLAPGDLVSVRGDLGSGKTTLVRGACRALGVTDRVTSPSFAIGNLYAGAVEVAHLDLWRVAGERAILDDYLTPERIAFVEWPDASLPDAACRVTLRHAGGARREIEVEWR